MHDELTNLDYTFLLMAITNCIPDWNHGIDVPVDTGLLATSSALTHIFLSL